MRLLNPEATRERPRAILFDLDDTLYAYHQPHERAMTAVRIKVERSLRVTAPQFDEAFAQARKGVKAVLGDTASAHSRLLYFHRTIEILA